MEPKECELNLELALNLPSEPKKAVVAATSIHNANNTLLSWSCSCPLWSLSSSCTRRSWTWSSSSSATKPANVESPAASTKLVVHDDAEESVGSSASSPTAELLEESYSDDDSLSWTSTSKPRTNKCPIISISPFSASNDFAVRNISYLNPRSGEIYYEKEKEKSGEGGGGGGKVSQQELMLTDVSRVLEAERNLPIKKRRLHIQLNI